MQVGFRKVRIPSRRREEVLRIRNFRHDSFMRLATRENIRQIDQLAASEYRLDTNLLVERVGEKAAEAFLRILEQEEISRRTSIVIWCGPGNNGADGKALGRSLAKVGFDIRIQENEEWNLPADQGVLVDAYFGVGLSRDITGALRRQIEKINKSSGFVIALDIPSGLDANRGLVLGVAIKAAWTLTVSPPKPGLFLQDGPELCGRIRRLDIGFPPELLERVANEVFLIGNASARQLLPPRSATGNKSKYGHLLVLAGSSGMEGAAAMVCEAAARMGAGYVTLCSSADFRRFALRPDFLHLSMSDFWKKDLLRYSAVVVGPGLGTGPETERILRRLLEGHPKVLVDADALTVLSQKPMRLPAEWVLTPHAGELSRLIERSAAEIEADRLASAKEAQLKWNAQILLKGFRTVLRNSQKFYIIGTGNKALSKAGTGDVLAGFIGSLMAQGLPTTKAGVLGAYLHGRIADDWLRRGRDSRILIASDLPELLDASLRSLKKGR